MTPQTWGMYDAKNLGHDAKNLGYDAKNLGYDMGGQGSESFFSSEKIQVGDLTWPIASLIASQAEDKEHLFNCVSLQSMSDPSIFNGERLSEALHTVSVIVTSTTGDGEVPEEAQPFLTNICSKSNIKNFRQAFLLIMHRIFNVSTLYS